jgi:hypothetical protein
VLASGAVGKSGAANQTLTLGVSAAGVKGITGVAGPVDGASGHTSTPGVTLTVGVAGAGTVGVRGDVHLGGVVAVEAQGTVATSSEVGVDLEVAVLAEGVVYEGRPPGLPNYRVLAILERPGVATRVLPRDDIPTATERAGRSITMRERVSRLIETRERTRATDVRERS